jgi:hypothetical protein
MDATRTLARIPDVLWAPAIEAVMILVVGAISLAAGQGWLFASLGPTAYEVAEFPLRPSARPSSIVVGHCVALAVGFGSVALFGAWNAPVAGTHAGIVHARLWASVVATLVTAGINILARTTQPAAMATTLLITLGPYQSGKGALEIVIGVLIIAALSIPLRQVGILRRKAGAPRAVPTRSPHAA